MICIIKVHAGHCGKNGQCESKTGSKRVQASRRDQDGGLFWVLTGAMGRRGGIQAMSAGGNGFGDEGRPELRQIFNFLALAAEGVLVPLKKMQKTNVGAAMIK